MNYRDIISTAIMIEDKQTGRVNRWMNIRVVFVFTDGQCKPSASTMHEMVLTSYLWLKIDVVEGDELIRCCEWDQLTGNMSMTNNTDLPIAALIKTEPISMRHIYTSTPSVCLRNAYLAFAFFSFVSQKQGPKAANRLVILINWLKIFYSSMLHVPKH